MTSEYDRAIRGGWRCQSDPPQVMVSLLHLWPWFSLAWGVAGGVGGGGGGKAVTFLGPPVQTVSITLKPYRLNQDQIMDTLNALKSNVMNISTDNHIFANASYCVLQYFFYGISFDSFDLRHPNKTAIIWNGFEFLNWPIALHKSYLAFWRSSHFQAILGLDWWNIFTD